MGPGSHRGPGKDRAGAGQGLGRGWVPRRERIPSEGLATGQGPGIGQRTCIGTGTSRSRAGAGDREAAGARRGSAVGAAPSPAPPRRPQPSPPGAPWHLQRGNSREKRGKRPREGTAPAAPGRRKDGMEGSGVGTRRPHGRNVSTPKSCRQANYHWQKPASAERAENESTRVRVCVCLCVCVCVPACPQPAEPSLPFPPHLQAQAIVSARSSRRQNISPPWLPRSGMRAFFPPCF